MFPLVWRVNLAPVCGWCVYGGGWHLGCPRIVTWSGFAETGFSLSIGSHGACDFWESRALGA